MGKNPDRTRNLYFHVSRYSVAQREEYVKNRHNTILIYIFNAFMS